MPNPSPPTTPMGERLRAARIAAALSQGDVAAKTGLRQAQVSAWELGYHVPAIRHMLILADTYGCSPLLLIGRAPEPSPTDPGELGEWLRALPHRTILRDRNGDTWQHGVGVEHGHLAPNREFPALLCIDCDVYEITDGHINVEDLSRYAPFTVLALGEGGA